MCIAVQGIFQASFINDIYLLSISTLTTDLFSYLYKIYSYKVIMIKDIVLRIFFNPKNSTALFTLFTEFFFIYIHYENTVYSCLVYAPVQKYNNAV